MDESNLATTKSKSTKPEGEDDPNLIGPCGFPLYNDKYNSKPLPKYDLGTINYATSNSHMSSSWIVDSGASEHISDNSQIFTTIHNCGPISNSLPNGDNLTVSMNGVVNVTPNITIHDVYLSLAFYVNLISVSRLTASSYYSFSFTDKHAFICDKVMKRIVGQADMIRGLYYLKHVPENTSSFFVGVITSTT